MVHNTTTIVQTEQVCQFTNRKLCTRCQPPSFRTEKVIILTTHLLLFTLSQTTISQRLLRPNVSDRSSSNNKSSYLAFLQGHDPILHSLGDNQSLNVHRAGLTQTMNTIPSLRFDSPGPREIERNDVVSTSEVQTDTCR